MVQVVEHLPSKCEALSPKVQTLVLPTKQNKQKPGARAELHSSHIGI
jgi:hypothetical protein